MDWKAPLRQLRNRVDAMVTRAVIGRVNESLKTARLQVTLLDGEVDDDVELFGPFGFHMSPPPGAEAIAVAVAGARSHTVVVASGAPGERPTDATARTGGMYQHAQWVLFVDEAGVVHVGAKAGAAFIARADLTDARLARLQAAFDAHVHSHAGAVGTPTPPTAVPDVIPVGPLASVAATKGKVT